MSLVVGNVKRTAPAVMDALVGYIVATVHEAQGRICDNGAEIARYDDLVDGKERPIDVSNVDVSTNGIELQDREFFAAILEGREPNGSVAQVLSAYQTLDRLEKILK
jgi:hypothetical protein